MTGSSMTFRSLAVASAVSSLLEPAAGAAPAAPALGEADPPAGVLLATWFRAHVDELWRFVGRLGVPAHSIDDVVQEAFVAANRRRADIGAGQARGFLFAAAVRLSSNYRQRAHVRREVSQGEQIEEAASRQPDAEQLLSDKRRCELLEQALAGLSDAHRTVFVLYELEGFSVPEIAGLLELPLGTVASRLGRARGKFSELATRLQRADREST
jgi:RNA polymerase sigma-70 factor, ECF subfamily